MRRLFLVLVSALALPDPWALTFAQEHHAPFRGPSSGGETLLLARDGGRGGRGRASWGGGAGRVSRGGGVRRGNTGFSRAPRSFDRGDRRPAGGWSNRVGSERMRQGFNQDRVRNRLDRVDRSQLENRLGQVNRDAVRQRFANVDRNQVRERFNSLDRDQVHQRIDGVNRDQLRDRYDNARNRYDDRWNNARDRWDDNRDRWNDRLDNAADRWDNRLDNAVNRWDNRLDRAVDRWNNDWPGWVRPGWGYARPWNYGWYGGWSQPPWGWWGASSVAWGIGTLATAAIINSAVNQAIEASRPSILVPQTGYTLYFNSIQPGVRDQLTFTAGNGQTTWPMTADCRQGTINSRNPSTAAEAQLLNAACQVAFGNTEEPLPAGG